MNSLKRAGMFLVEELARIGQADAKNHPPAPEITVKKAAFYSFIAVVGLVSGAADAAIATFHCDAAPMQECHYVVFDGDTPRAAQRVQGGQALTVDNVRGTDTYCRSVNGDPDAASLCASARSARCRF